jgi:uncharacterized membrane protein YtjA (UPF0391 family)
LISGESCKSANDRDGSSKNLTFTHAHQNFGAIHPAKEVKLMLGWAVTFLIIALIAAVLGFGGIAAASAGIAKLLFFLFLVICVVFFFLGWRGRRVP